jgi:drug/metabolite transporter (DMT)-like permease
MRGTFMMAAGFVFFWNSGFIGAEYALPYAGPYTLLFWRYGALLLLIGGYLWARGALTWPGWSEVVPAGIVGILAHGVWLGCVFFALKRGVPAGIVALVVALQPLVTGAFSGLATGERTPLLRWAGLVTGFVGVAIAVGVRTDFSDPGSVFGYLIPFGSVVAITVASLYQRRRDLRRREAGLPIAQALFYQSVGTFAATALPASFLEGLATEWNAGFVASMLWLVVAVSLLAYGLMWLLLARMDATRVASLFYLGPPVTMLMAWATLGDRLLPSDVAGLVVVLAGVALTYLPARGDGRRPTAGAGV